MCETVTVSVECAKEAHSALLILQDALYRSSKQWTRSGMLDTARLCDEHAAKVGAYADEMQKVVAAAEAAEGKH